MGGDHFSILKEKISTAHRQHLPFTSYRKPNSEQIAFIEQTVDDLYYLDNYDQQGFIFAPFTKENRPIIFPLDKCDLSFFNTFNFDKAKSELKDSTFGKQEHMELVNKTISFIQNSDVDKVVISRKETLKRENFDPITTYFKLLHSYKNALVYIWYHPEIGLWLGATPEVLVQVKNNRFKTMALAGTQEYIDTTDVKWASKERKEQQYVQDFITGQLKKIAIEPIVESTGTIKAGNLLHLQTVISGSLTTNNKLQDLIETLHPTPAVCGFPKDEALDFIIENENYDRAYYTGFLGELNFENQRKRNLRNIENQAYQLHKKNTDLFVNLRCMDVKDHLVNLYIGGGITKDSDPEKEYLETVAKSKTIKKCL